MRNEKLIIELMEEVKRLMLKVKDLEIKLALEKVK